MTSTGRTPAPRPNVCQSLPWLPVVLTLCSCGGGRLSPPPQEQTGSACWGTSTQKPSPYELIVKPQPGVDLDTFDRGLFSEAGVTGCIGRSAVTGACLVRLKGDGDPDAVARNLMTLGGNRLEYVVPNAPVYFEPTPPDEPTAGECSGPKDESVCQPQPAPAVPPADRCYKKQTQLIGLEAEQAWAAPAPLIPGGVPDAQTLNPIVTALIDTGIQLSHEDLRCNIFPGKDFTCGSNSCSTPPEDNSEKHGTRMAGIIAASANTFGVRGVAWNTQVMPLKIAVGSSSTDWQAGLAIEYAAAKKVSVVNASWMSVCPLPYVFDTLRGASAQGVLFVSAAGNDGKDLELAGRARYPAMYNLPNTVTVMSYSEGWQPTVSSNWGPHTVDLAAPGGAYTTLKCAAANCYGRAGPDSTSAATAYVSGAAALIKSAHRDWRPEWIKSLLMDSAIPEKALQGKSRTGGRLGLAGAMVGPLHVLAPAAGAHWKNGPNEVRWSNDYLSNLCTAVYIEISRDGVNYSSLLKATANIGEAMVRPAYVNAPQQARIRISCLPAGFQAVSKEFELEPRS